MEIIQERLEREFNLDLITTAPSVVYNVLQDRRRRWSASRTRRSCRRPQLIDRIEEPHRHDDDPRAGRVRRRRARALPGAARRSRRACSTPRADRVIVTYELPFAEVLFDFHDKLKSVSRGYASMDYELIGYRAGRPREGRHPRERRPARRALDHRPPATRRYPRGRVARREAEGVRPAAAVRGRHPGGHRRQDHRPRDGASALRKDVTAKCYGGDISRKRKLLEKQKEGKKRMKQVGSVEIPQKAFLAILKVD